MQPWSTYSFSFSTLLIFKCLPYPNILTLAKKSPRAWGVREINITSKNQYFCYWAISFELYSWDAESSPVVLYPLFGEFLGCNSSKFIWTQFVSYFLNVRRRMRSIIEKICEFFSRGKIMFSENDRLEKILYSHAKLTASVLNKWLVAA